MHERAPFGEFGDFDAALRVLEDWGLSIRMSRVTPFVRVPGVTCEFSWRVDGSSTTSDSAALFKKVEQRLFLRYLDHVRAVPPAHEALRRYQRAHLEDLVKRREFGEAVALSGELSKCDPPFVARDLVALAEALMKELERAAGR